MKTASRMRCALFLAACFCLPAVQSPLAATPATKPPSKQAPIPYVPTRHDTVRDLLWVADVSTNDVIYDLGSGDGRIVIAAVRDFHAQRAVGIELDAKLVEQSRLNAVAAGVADRVAFIHGDLFTNDFSPASVLVLYLGQNPNLDLRAKIIRSLKPGARVVSHEFGMGEWVADKTFEVRTPFLGMYGIWANPFRDNSNVPDYGNTAYRINHDTLTVWVVPHPIAGVWRGKPHPKSGAGELKLTLHQNLSGVSGFFQLPGDTNLSGSIRADLWGDHLRCWCIPTNANWHDGQMWIEGRFQGDRFTGGLWMQQGTNMVEAEWTARRDPADITGTWEWLNSSNEPVQLKLERREGKLLASYTDKNQKGDDWISNDAEPKPVFDTYDFGGGFYFTLLLGADKPTYRGGSRSRRPQDGWLIGEAIMDEGTLKGTMTFYPYPFSRPQTPGMSTPPFDRLDWQPKRLTP